MWTYSFTCLNDVSIHLCEWWNNMKQYEPMKPPQPPYCAAPRAARVPDVSEGSVPCRGHPCSGAWGWSGAAWACDARQQHSSPRREKYHFFSMKSMGKTCFYGKNLGPRYWSCFICAWVEIGNRCARCSIFMAMYGHVMWESSFQLLS